MKTNSMTRRGFLAGAAVGTIGLGGLALTGCAPQKQGEAAGAGATVGTGVPEKWDHEADVIVVGAGGGGLVASCRVADAGLDVILMEKADRVGGDTFMSAQSVIGLWEGKTAEGDSAELYLEELKNGHWGTEKGMAGVELPEEFPLTRAWLDNCTPMYEYAQGLGIEWAGYEAVPKAHYPQPQSETKGSRIFSPANGGVCSTLETAAKERGVDIMLSTPATQLIADESGRVVGLYGLDKNDNVITLKARRAVILASGSFNANRALMSRYLPAQGMGFCGGCDGNTGDGQMMAHAIGAELRDMSLGSHWMTYDDVTNTTLYNNCGGVYGGPEDLAGAMDYPFILVNYEGERFMAETMGYKWVGYHTNNQIGHKCYFVFDSGEICDAWLSIYKHRDALLLHEYDSLADLARAMQVPSDALEATVQKYNSFVEANEDADFGRSMRKASKIETPPFRAVRMAPRHYTTYGGIAIDPQARVLKEDGSVIEGLYAVGTCTGSIVEQEGLYYQGGVGQTMTFGYIAGSDIAAAEPVDA